MATIGTFIKSDNGFAGAVNTLCLNVKAKFVAALAPVYVEFEKQFGKAEIDKIRNYK